MNNRSMRRFGQQLDKTEIDKILEKNNYGILGLNGDDGYPYTVPLHYVYLDGKIYFHGTKGGGYKMDCINRCNKASFCVVDQSDIVSERFATNYRSVIVTGTVSQTSAEAKRKAMEKIVRNFSPAYEDKGMALIDKAIDMVEVMELIIEQKTGKEGHLMTAARQKEQKND